MTTEAGGASAIYPTLAVSAENVQGAIVRSYRPLLTHYFFFQIENVQKFRTSLENWLGSKALASESIFDATSKPQSKYEALRSLTSRGAHILTEKVSTSIRESLAQAASIRSEENAGSPLTIAFTWTGLERLGIDPLTLGTFPEVFRQGMAARAVILGDVGRSAPENWQGWLGNRKIHVLLGLILKRQEKEKCEADPSQAADDGQSLPELYRNAADLCESFEQGKNAIRDELRVFAEKTGLVVRHIECGYRPYRKFNGRPHPVEHFGFRDGVSQPFLTLSEPDQLQPAPPGGGHPRRDGTWDIVMPGEIFLGHPDEDNLTAIQPANADLRNNGTYMVFRKLAQDVVGFHNLLRENRLQTEDRDRLAAQMMGRWPNGAPVVRHPHRPHPYGTDSPTWLNDFRYNDEDPHGRKCPLGAHIRRTNPRDVQLRDFARRHRILRQSIPYGGELIGDTDEWDGKERGLLFICYNAQIDSQFELIQSHWINRGEMFGQAGLGRCPIAGSDSGKAESAFYVPDNPAPIILPELVTNRGGDYFFVPSISALRKIARAHKFPADERAIGFPEPMKSCPEISGEVGPDPVRKTLLGMAAAMVSRRSADNADQEVNSAPPLLPNAEGASDTRDDLPSLPDLIKMLRQLGIDPKILADEPYLELNPGLVETPQLFGEDRIKYLAILTLVEKPSPVIRLRLPFQEYLQGAQEEQHIAFVGQHADVVRVLSDETRFGVDHHKKAFDLLTRGYNFLMGMDTTGSDGTERQERHDMLRAALVELSQSRQTHAPNEHPSLWFTAELNKVVPPAVRSVMARVVPSGKVDAVSDLGLAVPVVVAEHLFGLGGPHRISPTAIAAMFGQLEFTDVPADWLNCLPPCLEHEKPAITITAWAQAVFREIFVNIIRARELTDHGRRMTDELLAHIEDLMEREYRQPGANPYRSLLTVLMEQRRTIINDPNKEKLFAERAKLILAELLVGGIYTVGKAFTNVLDFMLDPKFVQKVHFDGNVYDKESSDLSEKLFYILTEIAKMRPGADRDLKLDAFIGEALRFAFRSLLFRVCKETTEINGVEIKRGDLVAAIIAGANLDFRKFADATDLQSVFDFKLDRPPNNYLHFGAYRTLAPTADSQPVRSVHFCLGAELAKAELREMLLAIARLRNVRRAAGPRGALEELLRLPQSMVIRFDPMSGSDLLY